MTNPTLSIIRDDAASVADLAAHFCQSEAWVAGCLDAVDGNQDWRLMFSENEMVPTPAEQADYADGFTFGLAVLDGREQEADDVPVSECYAMAGGPVDASDIPW